MKRVLVPLAQGAEEIEAITIMDVLVRAGAQVFAASIDHQKEIQCARGSIIQAEYILADLCNDEFDLIALPGGGLGAANLAKSTLLQELCISQAQQNKAHAALCASPALVFSPWGLTQGKRATCYPSFKAKFDVLEFIDKGFVTDGALTTGQGPATAMGFSLELVRILFGQGKRDEVAKGLLYPH